MHYRGDNCHGHIHLTQQQSPGPPPQFVQCEAVFSLEFSGVCVLAMLTEFFLAVYPFSSPFPRTGDVPALGQSQKPLPYSSPHDEKERCDAEGYGDCPAVAVVSAHISRLGRDCRLKKNRNRKPAHVRTAIASKPRCFRREPASVSFKY